MWQDLRFAVRILAKNSGYAALAVLMMAIGIGVNTTAFSIVDCMFLRPPAVKEAGQVIVMESRRQGQHRSFSYSEYQDISKQSECLSGIVARSGHMALLDHNGDLEALKADWISDNFFSVLGVEMELGLPPAEGGSGDPQIIISHGLWQRRFGSDPAIVGKTTVIYGRNAVIRGVAAPNFGGAGSIFMTELWIPVSSLAAFNQQNTSFDYLLGRMRSGVKPVTARAEMNTIAQRLALAHPATNAGVNCTIKPIALGWIESVVMSLLFLGGPLLVLAICCANLSGMILVQSEARRNEMAVRLALGAGRSRLFRQMVTEGLLVALPGAGLGLVSAYWLLSLQKALMPQVLASLRVDLRMDLRVFVFSALAAVSTAIISGLAPAFQTLRMQVVPTLKGASGDRGTAKWRLGLRSALSVGQIALSLILLIATGLFLKSLVFSRDIDPGFDSRKKLLIVNVAPSLPSQSFYAPLIEKIRSLPSVKGCTFAFRMLLGSSGGGLSTEISIPGIDPPQGQKGFVVKQNAVGWNYFRTVGTGILHGREFDRHDDLTGQRVVVINETMAERFWPHADPLDKALIVRGSEYRVVGVAQDGKINGLHEFPEPYVYFPFAQAPRGEGVIIVETAGDPLKFSGVVKDEIRNTDKLALIAGVETLESLMDLALYQDRMLALSSGVLGTLGIILAAVGLYAVVAYLVRRRTHEIGIRMSLGAQQQNIVRLVLGGGFRLCLIGIVVGVPIAFFVMRLIAGLLYGVAPTDIWIFSASSLVVLVISLVASYAPARRAARINPIVALRHE
jgi:predicted permease